MQPSFLPPTPSELAGATGAVWSSLTKVPPAGMAVWGGGGGPMKPSLAATAAPTPGSVDGGGGAAPASSTMITLFQLAGQCVHVCLDAARRGVSIVHLRVVGADSSSAPPRCSFYAPAEVPLPAVTARILARALTAAAAAAASMTPPPGVEALLPPPHVPPTLAPELVAALHLCMSEDGAMDVTGQNQYMAACLIRDVAAHIITTRLATGSSGGSGITRAEVMKWFALPDGWTDGRHPMYHPAVCTNDTDRTMASHLLRMAAACALPVPGARPGLDVMAMYIAKQLSAIQSSQSPAFAPTPSPPTTTATTATANGGVHTTAPGGAPGTDVTTLAFGKGGGNSLPRCHVLVLCGQGYGTAALPLLAGLPPATPGILVTLPQGTVPVSFTCTLRDTAAAVLASAIGGALNAAVSGTPANAGSLSTTAADTVGRVLAGLLVAGTGGGKDGGAWTWGWCATPSMPRGAPSGGGGGPGGRGLEGAMEATFQTLPVSTGQTTAAAGLLDMPSPPLPPSPTTSGPSSSGGSGEGGVQVTALPAGTTLSKLPVPMGGLCLMHVPLLNMLVGTAPPAAPTMAPTVGAVMTTPSVSGLATPPRTYSRVPPPGLMDTTATTAAALHRALPVSPALRQGGAGFPSGPTSAPGTTDLFPPAGGPPGVDAGGSGMRPRGLFTPSLHGEGTAPAAGAEPGSSEGTTPVPTGAVMGMATNTGTHTQVTASPVTDRSGASSLTVGGGGPSTTAGHWSTAMWSVGDGSASRPGSVAAPVTSAGVRTGGGGAMGMVSWEGCEPEASPPASAPTLMAWGGHPATNYAAAGGGLLPDTNGGWGGGLVGGSGSGTPGGNGHTPSLASGAENGGAYTSGRHSAPSSPPTLLSQGAATGSGSGSGLPISHSPAFGHSLAAGGLGGGGGNTIRIPSRDGRTSTTLDASGSTGGDTGPTPLQPLGTGVTGLASLSLPTTLPRMGEPTLFTTPFPGVGGGVLGLGLGLAPTSSAGGGGGGMPAIGTSASSGNLAAVAMGSPVGPGFVVPPSPTGVDGGHSIVRPKPVPARNLSAGGEEGTMADAGGEGRGPPPTHVRGGGSGDAPAVHPATTPFIPPRTATFAPVSGAPAPITAAAAALKPGATGMATVGGGTMKVSPPLPPPTILAAGGGSGPGASSPPAAPTAADVDWSSLPPPTVEDNRLVADLVTKLRAYGLKIATNTTNTPGGTRTIVTLELPKLPGTSPHATASGGAGGVGTVLGAYVPPPVVATVARNATKTASLRESLRELQDRSHTRDDGRLELLGHIGFLETTLAGMFVCIYIVKDELSASYACQCIGNLAMMDYNRTRFAVMGAIELVVGCMATYASVFRVQKDAVVGLRHMAYENDANKAHIVEAGGVGAVVRALASTVSNFGSAAVQLQKQCFGAISIFAVHSTIGDGAKRAVIDAGGLPVMIRCMYANMADAQLVVAGLKAVGTLVSSAETRALARDAGCPDMCDAIAKSDTAATSREVQDALRQTMKRLGM